MVYRETFGPMNEQEITNIEIQFNVQFPTDYRMYLKEIGGGFAEWSESNGIYVEDVKDKVFIDEMFGNIDIDSEVEQEQTGKSPYEILIRSQGWTWMSIRRQCSAKAVPVQVYDLSTVMTTGVRVLRLEIN